VTDLPLNPATPVPAELNGQQLALYRALSAKEPGLAAMYYGSIHVLQHPENPECVAQAGHSLRELMNALPRYLDIPLPGEQARLGDKVAVLATRWGALTVQEDWRTDLPAINKFLAAAEELFGWLKTDRPKRKDRTAKMLVSLDPTGRPLPGVIETLRIAEWETYHDRFVAAAHHSEIDHAELTAIVYEFERFLLDRLEPRTFEDRAALDEIIREGEGRAQP